MVFAGAWLSDKFDLEVLSFGRESLAPKDSCKLEMSGRYLAYDVTLDGGWIFLSVAVMDRGDPPETLLSLPITPRAGDSFAKSSPRSNATTSASYSQSHLSRRSGKQWLSARMTTATNVAGSIGEPRSLAGRLISLLAIGGPLFNEPYCTRQARPGESVERLMRPKQE